MGAPLQKLSLINDIFQKCHWSMTVSKIIIDRSMTISKIVIDRSMTVLKGNETCPWVHLYKTVIDRSMTIFPNTIGTLTPIQNCHWLINDSFERYQDLSMGAPLQKCHWQLSMTFFPWHPGHMGSFTKVSLTDQWQFAYGHKSLTIVNDIRTYGHLSLTFVNDTKTYGHLSLILVNDNKKCHWLQSMTKKIVIECI